MTAAFLEDLQRVITRIGYETGKKNVSVGGQRFGKSRIGTITEERRIRMAPTRGKKPAGPYLRVKHGDVLSLNPEASAGRLDRARRRSTQRNRNRCHL